MAIELGSKLEGKVTGITNFGAFVELPDGITGLVHISEIADNYVKDVNEHLKVNDTVTVKVINVDKDGKIGLSIRKAVDKPEPVREERPARESGGGFQRREGGEQRGGGRPGGFSGKPGGFGGKPGGGFGSKPSYAKPSFDDKLTRFLKDSEERISSIKKNTESKRGGRGAKRS